MFMSWWDVCLCGSEVEGYVSVCMLVRGGRSLECVCGSEVEGHMSAYVGQRWKIT